MDEKKEHDSNELNWRQMRFVEHFVATGNATASYILAGYAREGAKQAAHNLIRSKKIKLAIAHERERMQSILKFKREDHLNILHGIATARLDDFCGLDLNDPRTVKNLGHRMYAVESFEHRKNGVRIKLRDPMAALNQLCQILGLDRAKDDRAPSQSTANRLLANLKLVTKANQKIEGHTPPDLESVSENRR